MMVMALLLAVMMMPNLQKKLSPESTEKVMFFLGTLHFIFLCVRKL